MASCTLGGVLSVKLSATYPGLSRTKWMGQVFNGKECGRHGGICGLSLNGSRHRPAYLTCLARNTWSCSTLFVVSCSSSQNKSRSGDVSDEKKSISRLNETISSSEVESLVTNICDTTSIAEFKLNLGGFRLYVKRELDNDESTSFPPSFPPVHVDTPIDIPNSNGSATTSSLAIFKPEKSSGEILSSADANSDEGLLMLTSPKVGFFRRSRTIKGKRAPPPCKEKQEVKEGQVLCYIEQLGGEIPIESDISGEVVKILREDGEPVGYGDPLIAILPAFPGIKKLQLPS